MAMLVPRLSISDWAARQLRRLADERGVTVASIIAAIVENRLNGEARPQDADEVLNRIIMVAERFGLGVGGSTIYPADWRTIGNIPDEKCREVAAGYQAWRHERRDGQAGSS